MLPVKGRLRGHPTAPADSGGLVRIRHAGDGDIGAAIQLRPVGGTEECGSGRKRQLKRRELRHVGKLNTRVLWFFMKGRRIVAVHGIRNKGQAIPARDLDTARERMRDWQKRNDP